MKGSPVLLLVLILNITVLAGFGFTIWQISNAMERRENIIKECMAK
jgi:type IV secretory pathway TrbD component